MTTRNELCWLRRIMFSVVTKNDGIGKDLVVQAHLLVRAAQKAAADKKAARNASRRKGTGNSYATGATMAQMIKNMTGK
jgi:hypothetical protein